LSEEPAIRGTSWIVTDAQASSRLDALVAAQSGISVHEARRLIDEGRISVETPGGAARSPRKGDRLVAGSRVEMRTAEVAVVPEEGDLVVLQVEEDLLALQKPGGLPLHPLRPGERGTLANRLVARFPECASASDDRREAGFVHRLDVATGGLVLAARGRAAWRAWRDVLGQGDCVKTYLAEVAGKPPAAWVVDAPIGRRGRHGATVTLEGGRGALPATTRFTTLHTLPDRAVVEATLSHGRAHQIRAHLAGSGFPILGDDRYGTPESHALSASLGADLLRLWAQRLEGTDPVTGSRRRWEAPAPPWARC